MAAFIHKFTSLRNEIKKAQGLWIEEDLTDYRKRVEKIRRIDFSREKDQALFKITGSLKQGLQGGLEDSLIETGFALVAEACRRRLGIEPYDVQLLAGLAMTRGRVVQMNTGEGKTLAAVFPAFLEALSGHGVHLLTANEYLAERDARWMGRIYELLGLSVGFVTEGMSREEKKRAYRADVTYLTMKQAGFDFLSDRLQYDPENQVQRSFNYALIDEADFILIDEARNPLILARPYRTAYLDFAAIGKFTEGLIKGQDFTLDREERNCFLTPRGQKKVGEEFSCGGIHEPINLEFYAAVHMALIARRLLRRDVDYIVRNNRIEIVDEGTGRVAEKRRWPHGIQTALEAKEGVTPNPEGRIYGSITVSQLANLYPNKSAMTATARPAAKEFLSIYNLPLTLIPPNRPSRMKHFSDRIFLRQEDKMKAVVEEILLNHRKQVPVLVGTSSVKESRELGALLTERRVVYRILNAEQDEEEAEIVAEAGRPSAITISTNMAGRGTDIRLGGRDEGEREKSLEVGGLYVLGTNRYASRRIDDQLRGRAGRQGDPGCSRFFVSLEDDLFRKYGVMEFLDKSIHFTAPGGINSAVRAGPLEDEKTSREIDRAQRIIEGRHSEMKRILYRYSEFVELLRRETEVIRQEALSKGNLPEEMEQECRGKMAALLKRFEESKIRSTLSLRFIRSLDEFWADLLDYVVGLKEGIHLRTLAGKNPLLEFLRELEEFYLQGYSDTCREVVKDFCSWESLPQQNREDSEDASANTWTYLVNEDPLPSFNLSMIRTGNLGFAAFYGLIAWIPLLAEGFISLVKRISRGLRRFQKS